MRGIGAAEGEELGQMEGEESGREKGRMEREGCVGGNGGESKIKECNRRERRVDEISSNVFSNSKQSGLQWCFLFLMSVFMVKPLGTVIILKKKARCG